jgi:hypothetical protein
MFFDVSFFKIDNWRDHRNVAYLSVYACCRYNNKLLFHS